MSKAAKIELLVIMVLLVILSHFLEREFRDRGSGPQEELVLKRFPIEEAPPEEPSILQKPDMPTYRIRAGDTLVKIAKRHYGDGRLWKKIYESNRSIVPDPRRLEVGVILKIPPLRSGSRTR